MTIRVGLPFSLGASFVLWLAIVSSTKGQALRPLPCPPEQVATFDFLIGDWRGVVFDLKGGDSSASGATAEVSAKKLLNGCALLEQWHFEENGRPEIEAVVLRAFDAGTGRWSYSLATNRNENVSYHGELADGHWSFFFEFPGAQPVKVRIRWVAARTGYSEQIARSTDGGVTWLPTRHINFSSRIIAKE